MFVVKKHTINLTPGKDRLPSDCRNHIMRSYIKFCALKLINSCKLLCYCFVLNVVGGDID